MLAHVPSLWASLVSRSQHAVCAPRLPTTSNPTCPTILLLPPCRPVSSAGAAETSGRPLDVSCRARPPAPAADTSTPVRTPKKKSKKLVDINGEVVKDLGNGMFQVKLENGVSVMGHLSGKIRQNRIRIVTGDKVTVELSPYDLTRGRLTYRFKPGEYEKLLEEQEGGKQGSGSAASSRDEE